MLRAEYLRYCQIRGRWWRGSLASPPTPMGWKWKLLPLFTDGHASEKSPSSFRKTYIRLMNYWVRASLSDWDLLFQFKKHHPMVQGCSQMMWLWFVSAPLGGKEPHIYLLQNMLSALFINLVNSNLVCRQTHNFIWTSASYLLWSGTAPGPDPPLIPESACSKVKCICYFPGWLHSNKAYFFAAEVSFRRTLYNTNFSP